MKNKENILVEKKREKRKEERERRKKRGKRKKERESRSEEKNRKNRKKAGFPIWKIRPLCLKISKEDSVED